MAWLMKVLLQVYRKKNRREKLNEMPTIKELLEQALEPNNWVFHKNLNARYDQKQKEGHPWLIIANNKTPGLQPVISARFRTSEKDYHIIEDNLYPHKSHLSRFEICKTNDCKLNKNGRILNSRQAINPEKDDWFCKEPDDDLPEKITLFYREQRKKNNE